MHSCGSVSNTLLVRIANEVMPVVFVVDPPACTQFCACAQRSCNDCGNAAVACHRVMLSTAAGSGENDSTGGSQACSMSQVCHSWSPIPKCRACRPPAAPHLAGALLQLCHQSGHLALLDMQQARHHSTTASRTSYCCCCICRASIDLLVDFTACRSCCHVCCCITMASWGTITAVPCVLIGLIATTQPSSCTSGRSVPRWRSASATSRLGSAAATGLPTGGCCCSLCGCEFGLQRSYAACVHGALVFKLLGELTHAGLGATASSLKQLKQSAVRWSYRQQESDAQTPACARLRVPSRKVAFEQQAHCCETALVRFEVHTAAQPPSLQVPQHHSAFTCCAALRCSRRALSAS